MRTVDTELTTLLSGWRPRPGQGSPKDQQGHSPGDTQAGPAKKGARSLWADPANRAEATRMRRPGGYPNHRRGHPESEGRPRKGLRTQPWGVCTRGKTPG